MEYPTDGVSLDLTTDGFRVRASCRSFADAVTRVGLAGVVSSLPFILWRDLIRGFWSDEGLSFWCTALFFVAWAAGAGYAGIVAMMSLFGVVRVSKIGPRGEIFTGIGKLGWTHRFQWSEFDRAYGNEVRLDTDQRGSKARYVVLQGAKRYRFGWQLPSERQTFLVSTLNNRVYSRP